MSKKILSIKEHINNKVKLKGAENANDVALPGVEKPLHSHNFASLIVGTPGSGKSSLVMSLLTQKTAYRNKFDRVYIFSPSFHTLPEKTQRLFHSSRVFSEMDDFPTVLESIKQDTLEIRDKDGKVVGHKPVKCLIIFDDMVKGIEKHKQEVQNFLYNRRHIGGGCSCMIITQKITSIPLSIRSACDGCFFFSLRSKKELDACFDNFTPFLEREEFNSAIRFCKDDTYCFLYIDLKHGKIHKRLNELEFVDHSDSDSD